MYIEISWTNGEKNYKTDQIFQTLCPASIAMAKLYGLVSLSPLTASICELMLCLFSRRSFTSVYKTFILVNSRFLSTFGETLCFIIVHKCRQLRISWANVMLWEKYSERGLMREEQNQKEIEELDSSKIRIETVKIR